MHSTLIPHTPLIPQPHALYFPGMVNEISLILKALEFAALRHRDQRRKDDVTPYINHPIALANVLSRDGGITDPDVLAAAILHDTLEDTQTNSGELRDAFGDKIAASRGMTDARACGEERKRLQIEHAASISREAKLVKLADKICNVRDVADQPPTKWDLRRRREYFDWAKAVVDRLRGTHPGLERRFDEIYALKPGDE